ncbi:hypothetical protein GCM10027160_13260 [Streptomyces calidiresistens]
MEWIRATVREWHDEEGWGVLEAASTPGGCWAHYSDIEMPAFRALTAGQEVDLLPEEPGFLQDGYPYRAVKVVPR